MHTPRFIHSHPSYMPTEACRIWPQAPRRPYRLTGFASQEMSGPNIALERDPWKEIQHHKEIRRDKKETNQEKN